MNNFNDYLEYIKDSKVKEAMLYSLNAGGKRIRPKLFDSVIKGFDIKNDEFNKIALALEMIHTYSLIHDDLPSMDNDTLRRGKNTCHIEFSEAVAILAGDALLTEAFNIISSCKLNSDILIKCINTLSSLSGANGMIYGQCLDMLYENKKITFEKLKTLHNCKTGALISASLQLACICCDKIEYIQLFKEIGYDIGFAFQIQDDILDYLSTSEKIGKSNSDLENNKSTILTIISVEKAKELVNEIYEDCKNKLLKIKEFNNKYLIDIINLLISREK